PPAVDETLAQDVKALRSQVDDLGGRVKDVQGRLDSLPKPEPAPDLAPLQAKVADLTKAAEAIGPLSQKVGDLDGRLAATDKSIKSLEEEAPALRDEARKTSERAAPPSASQPTTATSAPAAASSDEATLERAITLFKARQYPEARDVFRRLETSDPD